MNVFREYPHLQTLQNIVQKQNLDVFLVGGFLRDYLIGQPGNDFDFAVSKDALKLAEDFSEKIKGSYILLDQDRECARVVKKEKGLLLTFDFTLLRGKDITDDLKSRDFTINTLYAPLAQLDDLNAAIVDGTRARKDIKKKKIKRVSVRSFREDPLRMLRAFSLKATLSFKIEVSTLNQIRREKETIEDVSVERIVDELFKILETPEAAAILKSMDKCGLLVEILPQIKVMYDCKQGGYHHLDVWAHSLEAVIQLERVIYQKRHDAELTEYLNETIAGNHSRAALLKLATLLHDIGKPDARTKEPDGKLSFHGHEKIGRDIVRIIAHQLKLSTAERHFLEDITLYHLRPGYLSNFKNPSKKMVYRFFRDTKEEAASILLMSIADQRATRGPLTTEKDQAHHQLICERFIREFFDRKKEKPYVPLLDGNDILKKFRIKSSPLIGKILEEVREQHVLGKISKKSEAYKIGQEILKNEC